jgi:F-type H+-transporting ATPase subunit b
MESTLKSLADLLIQAVPTVLFFIFMTIYLNVVLFRPLARVMAERRKATEGARELAQQAFEAADRRESEFEHALHLARNQIYQENEALRRQWAEEQGRDLDQARAEAEKAIDEARSSIEEDTRQAQLQLDQSVQELSSRIVESLLRRRAA